MITNTRRRLLGSTIYGIGRLMRGLTLRRQSRRTVGTLHGMSDLQLKDIGLHCSEFDGRFRR